MSAETAAGPATAEGDILARAYEQIASCDELTEMITLIISKARSMRVDREAIGGLVTAARKLGDGDNWVAEALKGTGRDRFPTDVEMFDAIREVDDHLSAYNIDMTDLVDRAYTARKRARNALRLGQLQLAAAMAKPVKLKCDGCHDARQAAIDEANQKIDDARNREALADEAITILQEACSDVTAALVAIRGVPDDYEGCYAEALRLVREDPNAMPKDGDFLTGYGSRLAHRKVDNRAAQAIRSALAGEDGARPRDPAPAGSADPTPPGSEAACATGRPGRVTAYEVTITAKDGQPINPKIRSLLGLPDRESPEENVRAASNAALHRELARLRHPYLDVSYRLTGADGEPVGPAVRVVECSDRWLRHDLDGYGMFVYEKPSGKDRYQVFERGAGRRGTARQRAAVATLPEALALATSLAASTPEEILADVETYDDRSRQQVADLIRYSRPGTRLWVLPMYGEHGYSGTGQAATALGLGAIGVEAMFGTELGCWVIRYRGDDGTESTIGPVVAMTAEEAAARWWVVDGNGNLLSGGHHDKDRMTALAGELGGHPQLGLGHKPVPKVGDPRPATWARSAIAARLGSLSAQSAGGTDGSNPAIPGGAVQRVPEDLREVHDLVRQDPKAMPKNGDFITGQGDPVDGQRYLQRAALVEAHPDVTALLSAEALDRDSVLAEDAAQRMIAERSEDGPDTTTQEAPTPSGAGARAPALRNPGRCDWCGRPGERIRNRGENVCAPCIDQDIRTNGIDIRVTDARGNIPPFTYNTVKDADKVYPLNPDGIDGRDLPGPRARRAAAARRAPTTQVPVREVSLADGETRPVTRTWPDGSWDCPFCASPVIAGQERADWDQGCPNPACWVNMTAEGLAGARQRQEADAERRRDTERISQIQADMAAESRREEAEHWAEVSAEAEKRGACLECLRKSYWRSKPKFVRHRDTDYHNAARTPPIDGDFIPSVQDTTMQEAPAPDGAGARGQHEYWEEPDDKYGHLFRPRCTCGWRLSGTTTASIAQSFYARHLTESAGGERMNAERSETPSREASVPDGAGARAPSTTPTEKRYMRRCLKCGRPTYPDLDLFEVRPTWRTKWYSKVGKKRSFDCREGGSHDLAGTGADPCALS